MGEDEKPNRKRRRGPLGRLWKRVRIALTLALGPALVVGWVRLLRWTSRVDLVNYDSIVGFWERGERIIIAFWHGRMLMLPPMLPRGTRLGVLISEHRDGELITRVLGRFGIDAVRGSATRGGVRAAREMRRRVEEGWDLAITPDGPRGPAREVKPGVVELARISGAAIVPVTYSASRGWKMGSWDGFLVPGPGGRLVYVIGEPIRVPPRGSRIDVEETRGRLALELERITALADRKAAMRGRAGQAEAEPCT